MQKIYTHDEIVAGIDKAIIKITDRVLNDLLIEYTQEHNLFRSKIEMLKKFIINKQYEHIRRINRSPFKGVKERPDIEVFGGHIVIEVKSKENELKDGKKQLTRYIKRYYKNIAVIGIVTTGIRWEIYKKQGDKELVKIASYVGNQDEFHSGSIENTILASDLLEHLKRIFRNVLIETQVYRYKPTPEGIYLMFYPVITNIEVFKEFLNMYKIKERALYSSYKEILARVYGKLEKEELELLFTTHTILQMILNTVITGVLGKLEYIEPIMACSGEMTGYELSIPHLMWWKEIINKAKEEEKRLIKDICEDIYYRALLFNWNDQIVEDVFSHIYEDFIERALRYKIGEYYTPWWLIEFIISRLKQRFNIHLKNKLIYDPACGSGRFLVKAFYEKVKEGQDPDEAFYEVIGLDINPLATSIARAELMIAYRRVTKNQKPLPGTPLVFWGDFLSSEIALESELIYDLKNIINIVSKYVYFDREVIARLGKLNKHQLIMFLARLETYLANVFRELEKGNKSINYENTDFVAGDDIHSLAMLVLNKLLKDTLFMNTMSELINKYGNKIWAIPVVSHVFVGLLKRIKPDIVLTNPPWLKLSELPRSKWGVKVREFLKQKMMKDHKAKIPGLSKAGMSGDISMIFLWIIFEILEKKGYVGIVVPAEQSYLPKSPHGAGKLLTYSVLKEFNAQGEIFYVGDAFKHGRHASTMLLKVGE